jgi:hypothetical protein
VLLNALSLIFPCMKWQSFETQQKRKHVWYVANNFVNSFRHGKK